MPQRLIDQIIKLKRLEMSQEPDIVVWLVDYFVVCPICGLMPAFKKRVKPWPQENTLGPDDVCPGFTGGDGAAGSASGPGPGDGPGDGGPGDGGGDGGPGGTAGDA